MVEGRKGKVVGGLEVGQRDWINIAYIVDNIINHTFKLTCFAISAHAFTPQPSQNPQDAQLEHTDTQDRIQGDCECWTYSRSWDRPGLWSS